MQGDRLRQAETIFEALVNARPEERGALLAQRCGEDGELCAFVEQLLRHHEASGGILDPPAQTTDSQAANRQAGDDTVATRGTSGRAIGPYVLRERLGAGGMGEVWRAEQTTPVRRTVALKLIKAGMDSEQVIARFESERQALALMDHPAIAKVLDAGTTPEGRPYFAMEYVPGVPITEYCDRRRFGTRERLELFRRVCDGVQHAHQKAVIHRDLKPSNILVSEVDAKPLPKIIDFGVAKAMTQKLTERTMYTALGQMIGTPAYMSPEQAELTGLDVDTRTDIYSLGVLLYELLTGTLPFDTTTLREAGLDAFRRIIQEEEPPRPSTRISTLGEAAREAAARRRTDPPRWRKALRDELDWITMKALEKDRNRRYESASAMAGDIELYLADQPILARPPSATYQIQKLIARHRGSAAFVGSVITLLMVLGVVLGAFGYMTVLVAILVAFGITMSVMFAAQRAEKMRADRERDRAVREQEITALVTGTLEEMLASVNPTKSGRDVTVREMLDETAKTLGVKFKDQPLVEARLRHTVGETYSALGEDVAAEEHFRRAAQIRTERLGEEDPRTMLTVGSLAGALRAQDRQFEAEALYQETVERQCRVLGEEHPEALNTMRGLAVTYHNQGRVEEAEELLKRTLELQRRVLGREDESCLRTMISLATVYIRLERYDAMAELYMEGLAISQRVLGFEHPMTLNFTDGMAISYITQGRLEEAESIQRTLLNTSGRILGDEHQNTNTYRYNLACNLARQGRSSEAIAVLREAASHGFWTWWPSLHDDPDLSSLHGDPEFEAIVAELRRAHKNFERGFGRPVGHEGAAAVVPKPAPPR